MMNKKKLIIFTHGGGRFGNQLINFGNLIAFILENNEEFELINVAFFPYRNLINLTAKDNNLCLFPEQKSQYKKIKKIKKILDFFLDRSYGARMNLCRILYLITFILPKWQSIILGYKTGLKYNFYQYRIGLLQLSNPHDINLLKRKNTTVLGGWQLRDWNLFYKHQDLIRKNLSINEEYEGIANNFIQSLREEYELLIGILIRMGDYKIWRGGKYFFEIEQYLSWIEQANHIFGNSSNICFVIASDEQQNLQDFENFNVYFTTGIYGGKGHYAESLAELAKCDLVMTPPSTFGVWAAFMGNIPIMPLYAKSQILEEKSLLKNNIFDAIKHPHMSVSVK